jgi:molybdopterin-guanine dinucleotide biosynthesis protein A
VPEVVVAAREDTALPALPGVEVLREPGDTARHPRHGLLAALRHAGPGRPVLAIAVDLPLVPVDLLRALAAQPGAAAAADSEGRLQPLCARWPAGAEAVLGDDGPLTAALERLRPVVLPAPGSSLLNVNTPEDLARALAALRARGRPDAWLTDSESSPPS